MTRTHRIERFVGVDVQCARPVAYCILDQDAAMVDAGWVQGPTLTATANDLQAEVIRKTKGRSIAIGIDAPRMPLPSPREWNWDGHATQWRPRRPSEKGHGRHCEVILKALSIANPQWTPLIGESPLWMQLGYSLFNRLQGVGDVYEVFPSASYAALSGRPSPALTVSLSHFMPGPKDMLDACVAAWTVREFVEGRGWEVGGGDRLGSIILPGTAPAQSLVMNWPS
jgi:predicted nuclease with RNAse H fold